MLASSFLSLTILHYFIQSAHASPVSISTRGPPDAKQVIIQMFEWSWDSIASECKDFIGPAGYGFVQGSSLFSTIYRLPTDRDTVSPPQEHIQGPQWWTDYQPVSYKLQSKRGNREQFANMIKSCHDAGVKIIAGMHPSS